MRTWIVRTLLVAAVIGGFAVGRGLQAAAQVPSERQSFACGYTNQADGIPEWLNKRCDPTKSFTVEHYLISTGTGVEYLMCCVRR